MRVILFLLLLCSLSLSAKPFLNQQQLDDFASNNILMFTVDSNLLPEANQFSANISWQNKSAQSLPAGNSDWQLYFHSVRKIADIEQQGLQISHVQGDLHRISPTPRFNGLPAGEQLTLHYRSAPWVVSYSDFMPRAFITSSTLQPAIIANTDNEDFNAFVSPLNTEQQLKRNAGGTDMVPLADNRSRYLKNQQLTANLNKYNAHTRIIPKPISSEFKNKGFVLHAGWQILFSGRLTNEAGYLQQQLQQVGLKLMAKAMLPVATANNTITMQVDSNLPLSAEGYQLLLDEQSVRIIAKDNAGAFYAVQSLLALLHNTDKGLFLPIGKVSDQPRAGWRGMHYDMARNFHGKAVTLRLIENMARYKLNKLHLHLTEDEGWRLQIPGLPELTDIAAQRCFDLSEQQCLLTQLGTGPFISGSGNGFYSTEDFIEILRFAADRHIEVIPEIDMPGHARAAIVAMKARYQRLMAAKQPEAARQYLLSDPQDKSVYISVQNYTDNSANVCLPSTYAFIEKVVYELQQMYRQAGLTLTTYHMGGDEVAAGSWTASPACETLFATADNGIAGVADLKPYFVSKVAAITSKRGLQLAGWEDGLMYDQRNTFNRNQFSNTQVIANAWDNIWEWGVADRAYRLANNGYQVVLSPGTHLYFDHPHEAAADERGYYWASRYSSVDKVFGFMPDDLYANADTTRSGEPIVDLAALVGRELPTLQRPENILGLQGQVWSETIRNAEQLEQMIYPRLLAMAERAWHKADWETSKDQAKRRLDWTGFANRVSQVEYQRLAKMGSAMYLPPPGVIIDGNTVSVNSSMPGLPLQYSTDNGQSWSPYNTAIHFTQPILLRSAIDVHNTSRAITLPAL